MEKNKACLPILLSASTVAMIVSNIVGGKQFYLLGIPVTCGAIVFPVTYIISDVFSEVYGYKWSRLSAWISLGANVFSVLVFQLSIALPAVEWFSIQDAFSVVLGNTPRMLIASLISYMAGDFVNDLVFRAMKERDTENKRFKIRAITSSVAGEVTDSIVFQPLAFLGIMPIGEMLIAITAQTCVKTCIEILLLPITKQCVKICKNIEKQE